MENEQLILKMPSHQATLKVLDGAEGDPGRGAGHASVMGVMDRGNDVIGIGAFSSCLNSFLRDGVVTLGHDYQGLSIGDPESAEEVGQSLSVEWEYHKTQTAQEAREVAKTRLAKGKTVGLSVGFSIDYGLRQWFDNGKAMWAFLEKMQAPNLHLYSRESIEGCGDMCRLILGAKELFEFAQCSVPMNALAVMTDAKHFAPPAGVPLANHLDSVLAAVKSATDRLGSYKATRDRDDRPMSPERVQQAKELRDELETLIKSAEAKVAGQISPEDQALIDQMMIQRRSLQLITQ